MNEPSAPRDPAGTHRILAVLFVGALIGAIASSAGGGALGHREAFGTIEVLVAGMAIASLGLVNRRPA